MHEPVKMFTQSTMPRKKEQISSRLLKNSLRAGQAYNYLLSEIMPHTFHSASLAASARFSAAC